MDDYNFQLDDRLFSGAGKDHDTDPFHSMPALTEVCDDEDDNAGVGEISMCRSSGLNDLLNQNMTNLLCRASFDDTAKASSNTQLPLPAQADMQPTQSPNAHSLMV